MRLWLGQALEEGEQYERDQLPLESGELVTTVAVTSVSERAAERERERGERETQCV